MSLAHTAAQLAAGFASRAAAADLAGRLPPEDVAALRASGYLGISIPVEYGGHGLGARDCVAAHLQLAQGSASSALVAAMQVHIFGHEREARAWSEAHFAEFCAAGARGALFNSAASEPEMGSPARGGLPATYAEPHAEGGWSLHGRKTWTTGGTHLTHLLVRCRLGEAAAVALVRQGAAGVRWVETRGGALSLRASDSHDVILEGVHVPEADVVQRGGERRMPNGWFPLMMASVYLGAALAARDALIRYALERVPTALGKPIASLPKIQRQIGEMDVALQAAQLLLLDAAGAWDAAGAPALPRVTAAKYFAVETACRVTEQALEAAGGASLTAALPLERHFRDVRAGRMQPPSGDTALESVGQAAIGRVEEAWDDKNYKHG
jgi:alkylation response protein AidB-like acyl-CoA dehydrogenase